MSRAVLDAGVGRLHDLQELQQEVEVRKANEARLEEAHRQLQATQAQLVEAEGLRVLAETAGGAAHELSQPLQALILATDRLLAAGTAPSPEMVELIHGQIDRINGLVRPTARSTCGGGLASQAIIPQTGS